MNHWEFVPAKRKNKFGEWVCRCYCNGKRFPDGDDFQTTMQDMMQTMRWNVQNMKDNGDNAKVQGE